jgi:hypothetical protein
MSWFLPVMRERLFSRHGFDIMVIVLNALDSLGIARSFPGAGSSGNAAGYPPALVRRDVLPSSERDIFFLHNVCSDSMLQFNIS